VHVDDSVVIWGPEIIDEEPGFFDLPAGDLHLMANSPCVNRGTGEGAPSYDLDGDVRPFMGSVDMGADEFTGVHPLEADTFAIPAPTGGVVDFGLHAGSMHGGRKYIVMGSVSGTAPGTPLPGGMATLPINWDYVTLILLGMMSTPVCPDFYGLLDSDGTAGATLDTLGPIPGYAGLTLSFAYGLNNPWDFASNPIQVVITP
jgi:hypothetical protein